MSKTIKQARPETIEIWTTNEHTFYTQLQEHILNGYEVILEGFLTPANIGGVLSCHLKLKDCQQA